MEALSRLPGLAYLQPLVAIVVGLLGVVALALIGIMLLHTAHILGRQTALYKKREPVSGWSKRFYPACSSLIIGLLILMWLLSAWSHTVLHLRQHY